MSFAPDTYRDPTFFNGTLAQAIPFREAMSALHAVVVSDLRFKPKDHTAYKAWLAQYEQFYLLEEISDKKAKTAAQIQEVRQKLEALRQDKDRVLGSFYKARQRYFDYLYRLDLDAWFVLDPVITVHPDELFFECFSQDESSYGRVGCNYEVFKQIDSFACGTTNIDYSDALYNEFQKIRDYKQTKLAIDPSGFDLQTTGEENYKEVKIDLPDSWVRGFLQVSSAMTLPARQIELHPMDLHNFCLIMRRKKEREGPRSMRFHLTPGQALRVVFEPWNIEVRCPRSIYKGDESDEIRVWGRRRLLILEDLIPIARSFTLHLLGTGLPSFYVADLGDINFTLGLSGWTANDWSRLGNFDLMAPRTEVDVFTKQRVFQALRKVWKQHPDTLARELRLDRRTVMGALAAYTQAGRAIYDLNKQLYRVRELSREPLPLELLRFANPREEAASRIALQGKVQASSYQNPNGHTVFEGHVIDEIGEQFNAMLTLDRDERITDGLCSCSFFIRNRLYRGPCEHIIALRQTGNI
jgi:hypothetical protein